jgi:DUF4097 and DUF4098 domain-containing protein YvlB
MFTLLMTGAMALAMLAPQERTDTTLSVDAGARLELENFAGSVEVRTWDRPQVRVQATHSSRDRVEIRNSMLRLHIESGQDYDDDSDRRRSARRGPSSRVVEYTLTVPAAMSLSISGPYTDVTVENTRGEVNVETVQGEVIVRGGSGNISVESVQGSVTVEAARGRVNAHSVSESIVLRDIVGDISAEAVSGDITLEKIRATNVEATTVSGELMYEGTIADGGRYSFASHSGDVTLTIPQGSNAAISVSTFSGDFQAGFPVRLTDTRSRGKRFGFTIGNGSARVELESFSGDIEVNRPEDVR